MNHLMLKVRQLSKHAISAKRYASTLSPLTAISAIDGRYGKQTVELRDTFTLETRIQKSSFRRNPKSGATFFAKEKKKIFFKMSKNWAKKINEK